MTLFDKLKGCPLNLEFTTATRGGSVHSVVQFRNRSKLPLVNASRRTSRAVAVLAVSWALLSGCAHTRPGTGANEIPAPKNLTEILQQDLSDPAPSTRISHQNGDIIVNGIKLKNTHFDIPIVINSKV